MIAQNSTLSWSKKFTATFVVASALFMSACSSSDDNNSGNSEVEGCSGTIVEIASCNDGFETLVAAVEKAELAETLSSGSFTVFAPTDTAFSELFNKLGISASDFLDRNDLREILLYHVLAGAIDSTTAISLAGGENNEQVTQETSSLALARLSAGACDACEGSVFLISFSV